MCPLCCYMGGKRGDLLTCLTCWCCNERYKRCIVMDWVADTGDEPHMGVGSSSLSSWASLSPPPPLPTPCHHITSWLGSTNAGGGDGGGGGIKHLQSMLTSPELIICTLCISQKGSRHYCDFYFISVADCELE